MMNMDNIIDSIPTNIVVYRYENEHFIIVHFNKMALETEKLKLEDIKGRTLKSVFPGVEKFGLYDILLEVQKTGVAQDHDDHYYEDDRISGWRKNRVEKLENGDLIVTYTDETLNVEKSHRLESLSSI